MHGGPRREAATHSEGQHAGLLLASRAHVWPFWQQMSLKAAPSEVGHGNVLAGHCALASNGAVAAGTSACDTAQDAARARTMVVARLLPMTGNAASGDDDADGVAARLWWVSDADGDGRAGDRTLARSIHSSVGLSIICPSWQRAMQHESRDHARMHGWHMRAHDVIRSAAGG